MNKMHTPDPRPQAAGLLRYRLLDVQTLRSMPQTISRERHFLEPRAAHRLLLSALHGELVIDGRLCALRPGSVFVCAPEQLIELTNFSGDYFEALLLDFEVADAEAGTAAADSTRSPESALSSASALAASPALFPYLGEAYIPSTAVTAHLYDTVRSNWFRAGVSAHLRCEAALLELLSLVFAQQEQQAEFALESARHELERRYKEEVPVDSLARIAGLSRYHFMRLFKDRYGKSVTEYRTELRLTEAKRLMMAANPTSIERIVYEVGFKNETYFGQLFKKQIGVAPAIYQRNQQRRVAAYSWVNFGQILALQTIPYAAPMDQYWTDVYRSKFTYEVKVPLSHRYDYNYAALERAKPDFIVGMSELIPSEEQLKLASIAPTLFLSSYDDWRQHLKQTAAFLGEPQEAGKWLNRYNRKAEKLQQQLHPLFGGDALLVLLVSRDGLQVCGHRTCTVLYDDLGFAIPEGIAELEWLEPIEPHELAGLGAGRILVHVDNNELALARWTSLARSEQWHNLACVQAAELGKVHVDIGSAHFRSPWNDYSAYAHDTLLDDIPAMFALVTPLPL
ncbi:AraC family transcriptional regulator [Paenibacillus albus]|uniref:Helix-turn-helix domain-containing protein n=1 Tax=Paenibacillus albus TaxID=2495582 RepID=A0A3Q8X266_9BACL|nr:helix-turn-helix domain-containing protein [Paenibacillus albus]AZN38791.1 helix-turn-helix domain-containing protein [Paenibacillus albus]